MIYMPYRVDEFLRTLHDRDLRIRTPIEEIRMLLDAPMGEQPDEAKPEVVEEIEEVPIIIKEERVKQEQRNKSNCRELSPDRMDDFSQGSKILTRLL